MAKTGTTPLWIRTTILAGAALFTFALIVSAIYEPGIRVLHTLQALIYVLVVILSFRGSPWGFGAGCTIAAFWNYINLFVTTFIRNGAEQFVTLFQTGTLARPDVALGAVAGAGHLLLVAACLAGFLRQRPGSRAWLQFVAGGMIAIAYFVLIIAVTGPQYLHLLKQAVGL